MNLQQIYSKVLNSVRKAYISLANSDNGDYPSAQITYQGKQNNALMTYPYGLQANAPENTLVIVHKIGGEENLSGTPYCCKERFRNLKKGEVIIGSPKTGSYIKFDENGSIQALSNDGDVIITANNFVVDTPDFSLNNGNQESQNLTLDTLMPSYAVITDADQKLISGGATATEIGYLSGTLSNIQNQINDKLDSTLSSGEIFVGNALNIATPVAMSNDATLSNTGALTIANNAVTNAKLAQMAANTYKGNATASPANASDISTNTAFNKNFETSTGNLQMDGIATLGDSGNVPDAKHVHPSDTTKVDKTTLAILDAPNGFENTTDSVIYYNPTTRVASIQPTGASFNVWVNGTKYNFNTTITLAAHASTAGVLYLIYVDNTGTFQISSSIPSYFVSAYCSYIYYYDATHYIITEERHGCIMDQATHLEFHINVGTYYISGLAATGYAINPSSPTDANNQPMIATGVISDEGLMSTITAVSTPYYAAMYLTGASGIWTYDFLSVPFHYAAGSYMPYNQYTGGLWGLKTAANDNYINVYLCFVPSFSTLTQMICIPSQTTYSTLAAAQAETFANLSLPTFPFPEILPLYQINYRTHSSYTTLGKCRIEGFVKITGSRSIILSGAVPNHDSLAGANPASTIEPLGHIPYGVIPNGITATTQTTGNASDLIATDNFVNNSIAAAALSFETNTANIKMDGSVSVGVLSTVVRADHIHPSDTSKQNTLTNPVTGTGTSGQIAQFNGTTMLTSSNTLPSDTTATTQSASDNSTKVATTAYADANLATANQTIGQIAGGREPFYLDSVVVIPIGSNNSIPLTTLTQYPSGQSEISNAISVSSSTTTIVGAYLLSVPNMSWMAGIYGGITSAKFWVSVDNASYTTRLQANIMTSYPGGTATVSTTGTGTTRTATTSVAAFVAGDANADATIASYFQTPQGVYQITGYSDIQNVTITVPSGYVNETNVAYYKHSKLYGLQSGNITNTTVQEITFFSDPISEITPLSMPAWGWSYTNYNQLSVFLFATTTSSSSRTITLYYRGSNRYSYIETPKLLRVKSLPTLNQYGSEALNNYRDLAIASGSTTSAAMDWIVPTDCRILLDARALVWATTATGSRNCYFTLNYGDYSTGTYNQYGATTSSTPVNFTANYFQTISIAPFVTSWTNRTVGGFSLYAVSGTSINLHALGFITDYIPY